MNITRTTQTTLVAGLMVAMALTTSTSFAQQQSSTGYSFASIEVKYSELDPAGAAKLRTQLRNERERIEAQIRQTGNFIEKSRLIKEGRQRMQSLTYAVKRKFPSTTVVIHDDASRKDVERAIQTLRAGTAPLGVTIHVYGNGQSTTSESIDLVRRQPAYQPVLPIQQRNPPSFDGLRNTNTPIHSGGGAGISVTGSVANGNTSLFGF